MARRTHLGLSATPGPARTITAKTPTLPFVAAGIYHWVQMYFTRMDQMYRPSTFPHYHARHETPGEI